MNMIYPGHYPVIDTELWTAKQRQMCSLHEISYRACFKAELPEFFISRFSKENEIVYDPFAGGVQKPFKPVSWGGDLLPMTLIL
jgi:hypothetical protein